MTSTDTRDRMLFVLAAVCAVLLSVNFYTKFFDVSAG